MMMVKMIFWSNYWPVEIIFRDVTPCSPVEYQVASRQEGESLAV
jgi:hypothetical protein